MPVLIAMCGLSFSGKTTLARAISEETGAPIVSYDELWATVPRDPLLSGVDEWQFVFDLMCTRAGEHLAAGRSVIVDNLNEDTIDRGRLRDVAESNGAEVLVVHVEVPLDVIADRRAANDLARARGTTSDEMFEFVRSRFESPAEPECVFRYEWGDDLEAWLRRLQSALASLG
jgi:predicted kinase